MLESFCNLLIGIGASVIAVSYTHLDVYKRQRQHLQALMKKSRLSLAEAKEKYPDWYERRIVKTVSYTHLDVYKRQVY